VAGADGTIGVGRAARAAPDGYTLSAGQLGTHVLNGAVYSLQYDLVKDFEPISPLGSNAYVLITNSAFPANDLRELLAWAKSNEDKASVGVASTTQRLLASHFQNMTGTKLLMVPYRGAAQALRAAAAGEVAILRPAVQYAAATPCRQYEGLWRHLESTRPCITGNSNSG
jgi:tripartite-type tricarboxylate transporter receptor subunit TctC